ncbi:SMP-30/gluconolactonase/LRE family protein [Ureibacillus acetophenoni]|uniref:Sugar lactone lactonase YvrE n=1 Tax=Ureibacillus acetophenoni TaxID=614649 RepID=A0A285UBA5_9BACL|nr:SMP-30/gluconolactonase/LRE family protein [Ureibacillus acetophenoni]SOC37836.1 sugar lactone lactonase YvrE [Ureibacillus acetophenoni]
MKIEKVGQEKSIFGEGIFWDFEKEMVLWVDLATSRVLTYLIKTGEESSYYLPSPATAILKYSENEYLLIMSREINKLNIITGELSLYVSFEWMDPLLLLNDAKLDRFGRIWTGSVDIRFKEFRESDENAFNEYKPRIAQLYMIEHDKNIKVFNFPVALSNGLAFHPNQNILYHVDSATQSIWSYDLDLIGAELSNRQKVFEFDILEGFPDGLTIDCDGILWTVVFKSKQVAQKTKKNGFIAKIHPKTKELLEKIELPLYHITSCQFGGNEMKDLFITTASELLNEKELAEQPLSGNLLMIETATKGIVQKSIKELQIQ